MFKTILFPVDLSEVSAAIVPYVRAVAEVFKAQVHVLFVAREFQHYGAIGVAPASIADIESAIQANAKAGLDEFVAEHFVGIDTRAKLLQGHPAEIILDYANRNQVDLIMLGTHGRRGLERILFGSVAEHVVKNAPVPVFTINPYRRKASAEPAA
jgi:nucleotide-binding universal stress UspA family protein